VRLVWSEAALADLEGIVARAPRAAGHLYEAVGWLQSQPFPGMFRRLRDRPNEHVLPLPPRAIFYVVEGDTITVLRIVDGRQRREPW